MPHGVTRTGVVRLRRRLIASDGSGSRSGLGRATLLIASGSGAARLAGFLGALVGASALGPAGYGSFAYFAATAALIAAISMLGFAPLATRHIAASETRNRAQEVATFSTGVTVAIAIAMACAYACCALLRVPLVPGSERGQVLVPCMIAAWAALQVLPPQLSAVANGFSDFRLSATLTAVRAVAVSAGTGFAAIVTERADLTLCAAVTAEALSVILCAGLVRNRRWIVWRPGRRVDRRAFLVQSASAGVASLAISAAIWAAQFLLVHSSDGYAQNGAFAFANRLVLVVTFVPSAIAASSLPYLADHTIADDRVGARLRSVLRMTGISSVIAAAIAVAVAVTVVPIVLPEYGQFRWVIVLMLAAGVPISWNNVLGSVALAFHAIRAWVLSDLVLAAIMGLLAWLVVDHWHAEGVALAFLIAYGVSAVMLIPAARRGVTAS